mmetsp:Transcript_30490/g.39300  ORF Transcript_30490/g.39300 Transcript_30490/m.39300 type:complete len:153 (+) Transcript_30490:424-882(+)
MLVLVSKEKIGESTTTNIAREVQSLLRKIALQYEASHLVDIDKSLDFKSDIEIGPAIDAAVALILVWIRRSPHLTHIHHHHSTPPSTISATKALPNKKSKLGAMGVGDDHGSATMQPDEERQLRFYTISFALAASKASEALQKRRAASMRGF